MRYLSQVKLHASPRMGAALFFLTAALLMLPILRRLSRITSRVTTFSPVTPFWIARTSSFLRTGYIFRLV
jgi:hypothetical protein